MTNEYSDFVASAAAQADQTVNAALGTPTNAGAATAAPQVGGGPVLLPQGGVGNQAAGGMATGSSLTNAPSVFTPPDAGNYDAVADATAQGQFGFGAPSAAPSIPTPEAPSADSGGGGSGGGGGGKAPSIPNYGPYALDASGRVVYIPPPQGYMADVSGDQDSESGWFWNPTFQKYQRIIWNSKTFKWEPQTKFQDAPPTNVNGQITPGLPLAGGLQGRYPGEAGYGQMQNQAYGPNPGMAQFPVAPGNTPMLPSYLSPGSMAGQQVPFSSLGMPQLSSDYTDAQGNVITGAGTVGAQQVANTSPTQLEFRSPSGGYGIGVDTQQTLAAYGVKPSGDPTRDQAVSMGLLNRRAELEATGVPALIASEILRQEVKNTSGQNALANNASGMPAFARGGYMTVGRPTMMVDMQTGKPMGVFGEAGPETASFRPELNYNIHNPFIPDRGYRGLGHRPYVPEMGRKQTEAMPMPAPITIPFDNGMINRNRKDKPRNSSTSPLPLPMPANTSYAPVF